MTTTRQEDELAILQRMRDQHRAILSEAEKTIRRERPLVAALDDAMDAIKGKLPHQPPTLARWATLGNFSNRAVVTEQSSNIESRNGTSEPVKAIRRQPQYADTTIIAAIKSVLDSAKHYMHADELVAAIYEPVPQDQFLQVKRTIVSEVIRGMGKGWFKRGAKPNTFGSVKLPDEKSVKPD